jgi:flagellar biosynthesis protein FlhG
MPEITEETEYTGDLLRQVREARGLTIEQMANTTKIAIYYLRHLEAEEFEDLPAKVYVRGYLKQIAKLLRLEVEPMVRSFMDRIERPREE